MVPENTDQGSYSVSETADQFKEDSDTNLL